MGWVERGVQGRVERDVIYWGGWGGGVEVVGVCPPTIFKNSIFSFPSNSQYLS